MAQWPYAAAVVDSLHLVAVDYSHLVYADDDTCKDLGLWDNFAADVSYSLMY